MPSKDNLYNGRKGIGFENLSYFEKAKDLRPTLYDEKVIGLEYTSMFLIHSDEALEIEKFKRSRENKFEFAYDYGNLNANHLEDEVVNLLEKEKANLETIESLKSKGFESSESVVFELKNQNENDCHKIEIVCDKEENPKVIASGMFKLNVSQCVSPISMSKSSCDSKNVEIKLKRKRPDDFSKLKKITALLAKAFNRRKFYSKPTNNNLRTSSSYPSANKKQEFVKTDTKKVKKKDDEKKRNISRVKCYNCKKEGHFAKDYKKAKASSSSADEKISEVSYYLSESKSESEYETLEYYDNSTNYGLFMNNDDEQENFHNAVDSASENFIENHIDS
nr:hypothetical protein [Tanacetum cinerariifolium]